MQHVQIDGTFLANVYQGSDPAGFAQFLGRAAVDPDALVITTKPNTVGVVTIAPSTFELGRMAWGHHLYGDWKIFQIALEWARRRGADSFVYPISSEQENGAQLARILTRRYHFSQYQQLYVRRFHGGTDH